MSSGCQCVKISCGHANTSSDSVLLLLLLMATPSRRRAAHPRYLTVPPIYSAEDQGDTSCEQEDTKTRGTSGQCAADESRSRSRNHDAVDRCIGCVNHLLWLPHSRASETVESYPSYSDKNCTIVESRAATPRSIQNAPRFSYIFTDE